MRVIVALVCAFIGASSALSIPKEGHGRVLPIFNVIQFKNEPCVSTDDATGGSRTAQRNGTCYSSTACVDNGGVSRGTCAQGFGVCCVFYKSDCGSTINRNQTYISNPGFPSSYTDSGSTCSYTIEKCSDDICWLRLDFDSFTTQGPADSLETDGGVCQDTFDVTVNSGHRIPTICGMNTGQHMYIDIGENNGDTASLDFAFDSTVDGTRQWDIKVSQIPCYAEYAPPQGCLQYHTGRTGEFTTFNYLDATTSHLADQYYSVCLREELGMCCTHYWSCDDAQSFSLHGVTDTIGKFATEELCQRDYIRIEGAGFVRSDEAGIDRLCGFINNESEDYMVTDCTPPFNVDIHLDAQNDPDGGSIFTTMTAVSRGACLNYRQIPCGRHVLHH